jgi:8-oxo-dGTP pyrophosphatase MutT (NUDIX family)
MRAFETAQTPMRLGNSPKREVRTQFGALCYRVRRGKTQILLITSRTRGRWIIPKGWPSEGLTPAQSALQEAWEEAGVTGRVQDVCLGI